MRGVEDHELLLGAQAGDVQAIGTLLSRHEPVLKAAALRHLRDPVAAADAVQETFLVALRRIGDVRDPAAVRAWLLTVLHNVCRQGWRSAPPPTCALDRAAPVLADGPTQDEQLEELGCAAWLWTAIAALPADLQATVMLRHFARPSSYDEIALVLGVPVGTVRSRLNVARGRLAEGLRATVDAAHVDPDRVRRRAADEFGAATAELNAGTGCRGLVDLYAEEVTAHFSSGAVAQGRRTVRRSLEEDLAAGTRMHVTSVVASSAVTIVEADLVSSPDDPLRCPPRTCQVHLRRGGVTERVHLYFGT